MPRPKGKTDEQATISRILSAAESEFGRVGFASARLEDIAEAVGMRRPSLLYYFASKEILYAAVIERSIEQLTNLLLFEIEKRGTFAERVDSATARYILFLQEHPAISALILREVLDKGAGIEVLVRLLIPLLDFVEQFIKTSGILPNDFPFRQSVLQIATSALVYHASGDLRVTLWGGSDKTRELAHFLLVGGIHGSAKTSHEHQ